jgi:thioredoxin reductase
MTLTVDLVIVGMTAAAAAAAIDAARRGERVLVVGSGKMRPIAEACAGTLMPPVTAVENASRCWLASRWFQWMGLDQSKSF